MTLEGKLEGSSGEKGGRKDRRVDSSGSILKVLFPDDLFITEAYRGKEVDVTKTYHAGLGKYLYTVNGAELNGYERRYAKECARRYDRRKKSEKAGEK